MKRVFGEIVSFATVFLLFVTNAEAQYFSKYDGTPWLMQVNGGISSFQNSTESYLTPVVANATLMYSVTDKLSLVGSAEFSMFSDSLIDLMMYSVSFGPSLNMANIVNLNELGSWIWNLYGTFGVYSTDINDNGMIFSFGSDFGYWIKSNIGVVGSVKSNMLMMESPQLLSKIGRNQQVFSLGVVFAFGSDRGHVYYNY